MLRLCSALVLLSIWLLCPPATNAAIREVSVQEEACARTIGLNLRRAPDRSSERYVRRLAWHADLVIYGTAREIQHDIFGTYSTIVKLEPASALKGVIESEFLYIALLSGPHFYRSSNTIKRRELVGEPEFAEGELVLVFLTTDYPEHMGFELDPGQYRLINHAKWTIAGDSAKLQGTPSQTRTLDWIRREVSLAVATQQSECDDL